MFRKCPYCASGVSFLAVIKPALWRDERIRCKACDRQISEYWARSNLFFWILAGILTLSLIELLDSSWYLELVSLLLFYICILVLMYLFVPFRKAD